MEHNDRISALPKTSHEKHELGLVTMYFLTVTSQSCLTTNQTSEITTVLGLIRLNESK